MNVPRIRLRWRSLSAPATALLLALALALGVTVAPIGAQAADSTEITDMTEEDYKTLGLETNGDIPADTVGPYSQTKKTTVVTRSEVYMAANGAKGNRYTLRDKLENVQTANLGKNSKLADSWGNIWGAAKFWSDVNDIDHGSDLYNQSDYGGGDWSHLSDNGSDTVLANESSDFSGIHATSVELCLDAKLGKKSYVAELRAYGDDLSTKIDGKSYKGLVKVSIFAFDSRNNYKRFWVGDLFTTVNTNMMYEDGFKYLREGYLQELDGVFNITAGDVDGDGMDEIFAYTGCYVDESGQRKAVIDMFDLENGSTRNAQHKVLKVDAGSAADYTVKAHYGSDHDAAWTQLQSCPVVTLATGDLDRDFKDDLAITVSAPYGKSNIAESTYCELYTWNDDTSSLTHVNGIGENGRIALSSGGKTMLGANATFGTFAKRDEEGATTGNTVTGLIIAGYDWSGAAYDCGVWPTNVAYRYVYYDVDAGKYQISGYQDLPPANWVSGFQKIAMDTYGKMDQAKRYCCTMAPLALCAANLDGLTTSIRNDYILVGGTIYKGFACTVGTGANALGTEFGTISMSEQHYNAKNKLDHKGIDHSWISDVKAGCVSGSDDYRESFIAVVGSHRDEDLTKPDDYYWMTASHATLGQDGKLITGEEEVITESNRRNTRYGTFVSLALPDVDKDSVQIEFDQAQKVYTNPKVLAVLQDSPYYQELQDSFGYLVLGGTGYGQSKGSGDSNGGSISLEGGVAAEFDTGAPFVVGQLSVDVASEKGYEYEGEKTVNLSVSYESHAGEGDKAVIYTIPMVYYIYNATYEETGETGVISAPVVLDAETSVVSTETYDRIAERCGMTPLSYFLENKTGDPKTYKTEFETNSSKVITDSFGLGKPGVERVYSGSEFDGVGSSQGASVSQEIEVDESHTHSYEMGISVNSQFLGGASFRKQEFLGGFVLNFAAGYSHGWISSKGQSFGGTVDNLPEEAKGDYGFQWRLGVNMVDRDKFEEGSDGKKLGSKDTDKFWIIGYDVKDVQDPLVPAVTGFTAHAATDSSITFSWDDVLGSETTLRYGIGMLQGNTSEETVSSWKIVSGGTSECIWEGLEPNSNYRFVIAPIGSDNKPVGIRSAVVSVKTMPKGMRFNVEGPQATVELAGTENALNETTGLEYNSSITAASGQQVTLKALGGLDNENEDAAKPEKLYYTWFRKGRSENDWEICKREELKQGELSTLAIDIPTDSEAINKDQSSQYYCQIGINDVALNTGTTLIKIERPEAQLQATNRVNRPALRKLATLLQANANLFLDHSLVNTGTGADEPESPGTNDGANKPDDTKKPADTKKPVTAATAQGKLSDTGDKTFAMVEGIAVVGLALVGAGFVIAKRKRK